MGISAKQLKENIIEPALKKLDLYSEAAVNLLLGTAAQESHMGTYLKQINGPALGIYQMEPRTYSDIFDNYLKFRFQIFNGILNYCNYQSKPRVENLVDNLSLATLMARVHYLRVTIPLPAANDIEGLARYWKRHYNTSQGKGTVEEFIRNYQKYVEE